MKRKKKKRIIKTVEKCGIYCAGATGALIIWAAVEGVELETLSITGCTGATVIGTALMLISYFAYKHMISRQAKGRTHGNAYSLYLLKILKFLDKFIIP